MSAPAWTPRSIEPDDLAAMSIVELTDLYRAATAPDSVAALTPATHGRLLAVRGVDLVPAARALLTRLAAWPRFPWRGKHFEYADRNRGAGANRFHLFGERRGLAFHVHIDGSLLDGAPCLVLDYAQARNRRLVRRIRDELREVSPGLFMGPAFLRFPGRPRLAGYFACDSRPG